MRILLTLACLTSAAMAQNVIVFERVTTIPMDGNRVLKNQTVVVRDGRIVEAGPSSKVKAPAQATRVAGEGKFLMPGFAEMHGHLPNPNMPPDVVEDIMFLYVASGVTTVRGMLGHPTQLELRKKIDAGALAGPALYLAGPAVSGQSARTPEDAARMVREQKAAGYDLIKVQEGLSAETYEALVKTANEAGIRFGGHIPNSVSVLRAIEVKQSSIDHMDNYVEGLERDDSPIRNASAQERAQQLPFHLDEKKIPELARKTKQAGVWIVPTMALWEVFFGPEPVESLQKRDELKYVPKQMLEQWANQKRGIQQQSDPKAGARVLEVRRQLLKALHQAGANIMFGTDSPQVFSVPGFSIHREIPIMQAAGMSAYDVLRSGTVNAAAYFDLAKEFGTIAPGKRADLILLSANPLDDLKALVKPAGVMARGRWFSEAEINKRLQEIAARRSQ